MWLYEGAEAVPPESAIGFIYKITHIKSGRWYIGRKMIFGSKTKVIKGKKSKIKVDSDWKNYWSSSDELKELVANEGENEFKREIIIWCDTKAQMLYGEECCLFMTGALFDPLCFNSNIRAAIMKKWFLKAPNFHAALTKSLSSL